MSITWRRFGRDEIEDFLRLDIESEQFHRAAKIMAQSLGADLIEMRRNYIVARHELENAREVQVPKLIAVLGEKVKQIRAVVEQRDEARAELAELKPVKP